MSSFVWSYFKKDKPQKGTATCTVDSCGTEIKCAHGTSTLRYHLEQAHSITDKTHQDKKAKRQRTLSSAFAAAPPVKSSDKRFRNLPQQKRLAVLWSEEDLAFRLIDRPAFRACFGSNIPIGFNRETLSQTIKDILNIAFNYRLVHEWSETYKRNMEEMTG
eukprot:Hpha_TRINITY_DN24596_c0_g1::TRINITY_DN24596_c0_g1_i1::g.172663::m.172663